MVSTKTHILLLVLVIVSQTSSMASADNSAKIQFFDATKSPRHIGSTYENRCNAPSKKEVTAALRAARNRNVDITVEEFLGGSISHIKIHFIRPGLSFEQATDSIREVLGRVILSTADPYLDPSLHINWAEGSPVAVSASICFLHPEISAAGVISGCGVMELSGGHLFFQDSRGISWWHRWTDMHKQRDQ